MQEIFRYQQLRQSQRLSDEQQRLVGLSVYPDDGHSALAKQLIEFNSTGGSVESLTAAIVQHNRLEKPIVGVNDLPTAIRVLYDWLNFKAKPIQRRDLATFLASLNPMEGFDLTKEWVRYADALAIACYQKTVSINYCVDFQLLIRICYLFRLGIKVNDGALQITEGLTDAAIQAILEQPVLLPALILRSRCSGNCKEAGAVELPAAPAGGDGAQRGKDPCECKCDQTCQNPSSHCVCIKTYVADLFVIKEELARYEAADIADIENILTGEKKVHRHRRLFRTEDTTETENETVTSDERDHQATEKLSLQQEVKSTIDTKVGVDAGVTATLKYGEAITITPHANVSANYSKTTADSVARSYAKEVVDRSVTKIQEKVRKLQVSKAITETEERNKHSIDNTLPGSGHRAGIYYWVNKITHGQVFNYGKHMMFDAILPEPAALFKKLYQEKILLDKTKNEPPKPTVTIHDIKRDNYGDLLNRYAISSTDELQPPDPATALQVAFSQNVAKPDDNKNIGFSSNEFKTSEVPKGYKAARMIFDVRANSGHPKSTDHDDEVAVSVHVGNTVLMVNHLNEYQAAEDGTSLPLPIANWMANGTRNMSGEEGVITVALAGFSSLAFSISGAVSVICELKADAFEKWQAMIYNLIMADYSRKLDAYNSSNNKNDQLIQIKGRNAFLNREIERNEIKRHIIAILLCNYFNGIGSLLEKTAPCGYPEIDFAKLEKDAPVIQFFEQVFEWPYCNYLFYHSMWARKCKWPELIDEDSGDPLFDKFLTAGAARVQVPIREGMEDVFAWFLKTGQIWGASGIPPVSGDPEYVSMIQELKESKQCDYNDRPGLVQAVDGSNLLQLTGSTFYWDFVTSQVNTLTLANDEDRELLINYKVYRIVKVEQSNPGDPSAWEITVDPPYRDPSAINLKHGVGAQFVGAPWEIVIPTELVYLRNPTDLLPTYPLT